MSKATITAAMWALLTRLDGKAEGERYTMSGAGEEERQAEQRCWDADLTERNAFDSQLVQISAAGRAVVADRRARRDGFIRALARYLVGNQVQMSVLLQMGKAEAVLWSQMRGQTPLVGYPTVEEAERTLRAWFDAGMSG